MNIVIFGPPGAGKGTQSNLIVKNFKLHQLSTGELLRQEIKDKTKLGLQISSIINAGNLVSDEIVGDLIEKYISNNIYKNKLIFDGYPRNLNQDKTYTFILSINDNESYCENKDTVLVTCKKNVGVASDVKYELIRASNKDNKVFIDLEITNKQNWP